MNLKKYKKNILKIYEEIRKNQEEAINFDIDSGKEEKEEKDNQSIIILKVFLECFKEKNNPK